MTSVSSKYNSTPFVALLALKITVLADIGNPGKNVRQVSPFWASEYRLEDFSMLLLRAVIAFRSTLLERLDQIIRQVTYDELRHGNLHRCRMP
jgi:hypothetical protein